MGTILPGIRGAEREPPLLVAAVEEDGHEQRLAGQQPLAGAHQRAEKSTLLLLRAVAEDGLHLDAVVHVHHAAGLGHRGFVRIQFDFDELQVVAKNLVVDLVHVSHVGMLRDAYFFASSS